MELKTLSVRLLSLSCRGHGGFHSGWREHSACRLYPGSAAVGAARRSLRLRHAVSWDYQPGLSLKSCLLLTALRWSQSCALTFSSKKIERCLSDFFFFLVMKSTPAAVEIKWTRWCTSIFQLISDLSNIYQGVIWLKHMHFSWSVDAQKKLHSLCSFNCVFPVSVMDGCTFILSFRCRYHSNLRLPLIYPHPYRQITVETEFDNPLYETAGVSFQCIQGLYNQPFYRRSHCFLC